MHTFLLPALTTLASIADAADVRVFAWDERRITQKQAYGEKFLGETIAPVSRSSRTFP